MADIWQGIRNLTGVPSEHLERLGEAYNDPPWSNTPEYHQWATKDFVEEKAKQLAGIPYVGGVAADVFKKVAPVGAFGASPIYDTAQALYKYNQDPGKYETNNKWDKVNAYFPDLQGTTASGILNAIDMENPLSAAYNRMIGAGQVGIESKINKQNQIQDLLKQGWNAIKNEFGGDVEAAEQVEPYGPQRFETNTRMPVIDPNLNRLREEYEKKNPGIWEAIKNEFSGSAQADEIPINNITSSRILPEKKPLDTSRFKNMYWGPSSEEEGEVTTQEGIPGTNKWQRFLSKITRQPYRGAARPAGGYTPTQLNQMNALGGYYSEPARQQRSERKRVANMLARQAAGKSYSQANLNRLTMGSRPGHYDPPGGGGAAADTSPSTPGNNPWGRADGGLATMFQRR